MEDSTVSPETQYLDIYHVQEETNLMNSFNQSDMTHPPPLQAADAAYKPPRRRLQPLTFHELQDMPKIFSLIKGVLDQGGSSVIYGDSNSGKTFIAVMMALYIALGWEWCGRRVRQCRVLYIAAEAGGSIVRRLEAFALHHGLKDLPGFHLIPAAVNFCSTEKDAQEVITEAQALGGVGLIVIDTLARAMAGGNENGPDDMGAFIRNIDLIREKTGAQVEIIHHSGKDPTKGGRGHSSLRAAVDTEIEVIQSENGIITAEIKKQRDGQKGDKFCFVLESVELGKDEDGDLITSCVLIPTEEPPAQKLKGSGGRQARALTILHNLLTEHGEPGVPKKGMTELVFVRLDDFRTALKDGNIIASDKPDNVRRGISKVIEDLNNKGITATWEDKIWAIG